MDAFKAVFWSFFGVRKKTEYDKDAKQLNLVNNAFAAMSDGGNLQIWARLENAQTIELTVKDDGCGISEGDMERIFEPFFTTKKDKGGTGLGLSITYGLVQEIGGTIRDDSEVGRGATFTITLPIQGGGRKDQD